MERSSSAFKASNSGDGLAVVSGGMAGSCGADIRNKKALSAAQSKKRRVAHTGMKWFKSASLTIRRDIQSFSVRHRRWRDKAWVGRREAVKVLQQIRWHARLPRCN